MLFRADVPHASLLISPSESGALSSNPEEKLKQPSILRRNTDSNLHNWLFTHQTLFPVMTASLIRERRAEQRQYYNPVGMKTCDEECLRTIVTCIEIVNWSHVTRIEIHNINIVNVLINLYRTLKEKLMFSSSF